MASADKIMDVLYVLPTKRFFLDGRCGRVSHALGFSKGVLGHDKSLSILSGPNIDEYVDENEKLRIFSVSGFFVFWMPFLVLRLFLLQRKAEIVVIRWRPLVPFFLLPLLLVRNKIWFEVNSITGLDSRFAIVRLISCASVYLVARFFRLIVVSDESKRQVERVCSNCKEIVVIRNGFDAVFFEGFTPLVQEGSGCTLVYFGRKQNYYDWDMLYSTVSRLKSEYRGLTMDIFGFDEAEGRDGIRSHGEFSPQNIKGLLSSVKNPVLVLHAADSDVARAGSPMKLYEYAALGVPCVLSSSLSDKVETLPGFIEYQAGSASSLEESISHVIDNYEDFLDKAKMSRVFAMDNYTWPSVVRVWVERF